MMNNWTGGECDKTCFATLPHFFILKVKISQTLLLLFEGKMV